MTFRHYFYLLLCLLSFLNLLRQDDYLGAVLSLLVIPMIFMLNQFPKPK